jgi:hypothetical protein
MEAEVTTTTTPGGVDPVPEPIKPEEMVAQLRAYRERIPNYGQLTVAEAQRKRRVASLKPGFVNASMNAVGASQTVETALGTTSADLMEQNADVVRWAQVEDELRALLKGVVSANLIRRHQVGVAALQSYAISRQLVRSPEHADLLPHVAEMTRLSRRHRKAETPADPAPQPEPQVSESADPPLQSTES